MVEGMGEVMGVGMVMDTAVDTALESSVMKMRNSINWRVATLALGVWLALLTAAVPWLHHHPQGDPPIPPDAPCVAADRTGGPSYSASFLANDMSRLEAHDDFDHCPACLFLKTCLKRAIVWKAPAPALSLVRHPPQRTHLCYTSPDVTSSSPRGPPALHS